MLKTFSRRLGKQEMFAGNVLNRENRLNELKTFNNYNDVTGTALGILFLTLSTCCFYIKV